MITKRVNAPDRAGVAVAVSRARTPAPRAPWSEPGRLLREWIADLREQGPYEGLAGRLSDGHGNYCAMGRLCRLAVELVEAVDETREGWEIGFAVRDRWTGAHGVAPVYLAELPPAFAEWLGLTWEDQGELIRINDHYRRSFARAADWIERKLLPRVERRRQGKAWK